MTLTETNKTVPEIWDTVVRNLGGKRIKSFTMACSLFNNFVDIDSFTKDSFSDAILLKNSLRIAFCTYSRRNRYVIFECAIDDVEQLFYYNEANEHILFLHALDDGMFWKLNISL